MVLINKAIISYYSESVDVSQHLWILHNVSMLLLSNLTQPDIVSLRLEIFEHLALRCLWRALYVFWSAYSIRFILMYHYTCFKSFPVSTLQLVITFGSFHIIWTNLLKVRARNNPDLLKFTYLYYFYGNESNITEWAKSETVPARPLDHLTRNDPFWINAGDLTWPKLIHSLVRNSCLWRKRINFPL